MTRRRLLIGIGALSVGGAAVVLRPPRIRVTRHRVEWTTRRPFRVVHLTDVHVGWTTPSSLLDEAARLAHSLRPDLVVLTGDYVNHTLKQTGALGRWIERLPRPCVATLGNHDHWCGAETIRTLLEQRGVQVLANERFDVDGIQIVGVDDARTRHHDVARAFARVDREQRILALQHCPGIADQLVKQGASLVLSGHTHGGQVAVPVVTSRVFEAFGQPYSAGGYQVGSCLVYVNAGIGHSMRVLRHGRKASPELAVFDLIPEGST